MSLTPYQNADIVRKSYAVRFAQVKVCYLGGNLVELRRGGAHWMTVTVGEAIAQLRHWQFLDRRKRKRKQREEANVKPL